MGFGFSNGSRRSTSGLRFRYGHNNDHTVINAQGNVVAGPFADYDEAKARFDELRVQAATTTSTGKKRNRKVFPSSEIGHLWMHKAVPEARNGTGTVYFEGDTIFSYGSHFPIAKHVENSRGEKAILFTTRSYSVTTSAHMSHVRGAIPSGTLVFEVPLRREQWGVSQLDHEANLKDYAERVQQGVLKAARARTEHSIEWALKSAAATREAAIRYAEFFDLPVPEIEPVPEPDAERLAEVRKKERERIARETAEEKRRRAEREAEEKRILAERAATFLFRLEEWRRGGRPQFYHHEDVPTMLRIEGNEVVTSRGARFPVRHAKRGLHLVLAVKQAGIEWDRRTSAGNPRLGHYEIDRIDIEGNVTAGCHFVPFAEIERLIPQLDHNPEPAAPETEDEREVA